MAVAAQLRLRHPAQPRHGVPGRQRCSCSSPRRRAASACRSTSSSARWPRTSASGPSASCSRAPAATARSACGPSRAKAAWSWRRRRDTPSYDGMPRSAIATGLVDFVLPPAEMPAQLLAYVAHAFGTLAPRPASALPPMPRTTLKQDLHPAARPDRPRLSRTTSPTPSAAASSGAWRCTRSTALDDYVAVPAADTGRGGGAVSRPADRRHQLLPRPGGLRGAASEQVIPALFAGKPPGRACASGCRAAPPARRPTRIAMLLQEHMETTEAALSRCRSSPPTSTPRHRPAAPGVYPASIAADVSPERLARFFVQEPTAALPRQQGDPRHAGVLRAGRRSRTRRSPGST